MSRQTVLLLFGGESSEHDVSIMSARNVYAAMDNAKYDVKLCYIDKVGKWWLLDGWKENPHQHGGVQLAAVPATKSFITIPGNNVLHVDVVFPLVHGQNGEDGTLQGLLEMLHVPFVGSGSEASAVCMNKVASKQLAGVKVTPWMAFYKGDDIEQKLANKDTVCGDLGDGPWFVKPAREGSSMGVTRVTDYNELASAISTAQNYDTIAIVEKAIIGHELEVGILGNPPHHSASAVAEIKPKDTYYDFTQKYSADSGLEIDIPAHVNETVLNEVRQSAMKIYNNVGCEGMARVDFFADDEGNVYFNELNTIPGFTNASVYPMLWHQQGIKYPQLIDKLIELALG